MFHNPISFRKQEASQSQLFFNPILSKSNEAMTSRTYGVKSKFFSLYVLWTYYLFCNLSTCTTHLITNLIIWSYVTKQTPVPSLNHI